MEDIPLEDEPFGPFDDYDDNFDDHFMQQVAARETNVQHEAIGTESISTAAGSTVTKVGVASPNSHPSSFSSSNVDKSPSNDHDSESLPQQTDFLGMLQTQKRQAEREAQQQQQHRQQQYQQQERSQGRRDGRGGGRANGFTGGDAGDLATVSVTKKRARPVRLDHERLLSEKGFPMLLNHAKRFKIRTNYKDAAEKDNNAMKNLEDLMRVYQMWAHNLFPKATFRDFIITAEARCKSEKIMKATMDGWRDAYWNKRFEESTAKEDAEYAEQRAQTSRESVWNEHEMEMAKSASMQDMDRDPLSSISEIDKRSRDNETSTSSSHLKSVQMQKQPRPRPITSQKGKGKATDDVSAAMHLTVSDDGSEIEDGYEEALQRMRISMDSGLQNSSNDYNVSAGSSSRRSYLGNREATAQKEGAGQAPRHDFEGNEDEGDEDEEDEPLFTHRALRMMGSSISNDILGKDVPSHTITTPKDGTQMNHASSEKSIKPPPIEDSMNSISNPAQALVQSDPVLAKDFDFDATLPLPLPDGNSPSMGIRINRLGRLEDGDEDEDEEDTLALRKPVKGRRAIMLDDSDDE